MVAYSFEAQFEEPMIDGRKKHTIRNDRKRHARPGETLQLYTGMRTKRCRLIGTAICWKVERIRMHLAAERQRIFIFHSDGSLTKIFPLGLDEFAIGDGFRSWAEMEAFWARRHAKVMIFEGVMIWWTGFAPASNSLSAWYRKSAAA